LAGAGGLELYTNVDIIYVYDSIDYYLTTEVEKKPQKVVRILVYMQAKAPLIHGALH
jgi:hypothetical protein